MTQTSLLLMLSSLTLLGAGAEDPVHRVIKPGQEELVGRMMTADLPRGWDVGEVSIGQDHVDALYTHRESGGRLQVGLHHVSWSGEAVFRTEQFAAVTGKTQPTPEAEALLTRIEANVRSMEAEWSWSEIALDPMGEEHSASLRLPPRFVAWANLRVTAMAGFERRARAWIRARVFMRTPDEPDSPHWKDTRGAWDLIYAAEAALAHEERDRAAAALEELERFQERIAPRSRPMIANQIGFLFYETGDIPRSELWFLKVREDAGPLLDRTGPSGSDAFLIHLEVLRADIGLGRFPQPDALAAQVLTLAPDPDAACEGFELASSFRRRGRPDLGLAFLQQLHERLGDCKRGYRIAADLAIRTERTAELLDLLRDGAETYPDDVGIVSALAEHYKFVGEPDRAIALLQGLVDRGARTSGLMGSLDALYAQSPDRAEHRARFIRVADAAPEDAASAFFAGSLLHYDGEHERSNQYLMRAAEGLPGVARVFIYIAMNHHRGKGDRAQAAKYIDLAFAAGARDPDIYYCRGIINMDVEPEATIQDLRRYLSLTRTSWDVPKEKARLVETIIERLESCKHEAMPSQCIGLDPP
ncbi:MAG: hypothetical protein ABIK09_00200 [Pseudomonadota bacterium]